MLDHFSIFSSSGHSIHIVWCDAEQEYDVLEGSHFFNKLYNVSRFHCIIYQNIWRGIWDISQWLVVSCVAKILLFLHYFKTSIDFPIDEQYVERWKLRDTHKSLIREDHILVWMRERWISKVYLSTPTFVTLQNMLQCKPFVRRKH